MELDLFSTILKANLKDSKPLQQSQQELSNSLELT